MTEFMMLDELDDEILNYDANSSHNDINKMDSILIKRILNEMKNEFNKCPEKNSGSEKLVVSNNNSNSSFSGDIKPELADDEANNVPDTEGTDLLNREEACFTDDNSIHDSYPDPKDDNEVPSVKQDAEDSVEERIEGTELSEPDHVNGSESTNDNESRELPQTKDISSSHPPSPVKSECQEQENETVEDNAFPNNATAENEAPLTDAESNCAETLSTNPSDDLYEVKRTRRVSKVCTVSSAPASDNESSVNVKRSSRRMSKEHSRESVLQSAIALKEKSFGSLNLPEEKPQRRSTRLVETEQRCSTRLRHRSPRYSWQESTDSTSDVSVNECYQKNNGKPVSLKPSSERTPSEEDNKTEDSKTGVLDDQFSEEEGEDEGDLSEDYYPSHSKRRKKLNLNSDKGSKKMKVNNDCERSSVVSESNAAEQPAGDTHLCECSVITKLYARVDESAGEVFCSAVDSVEKSARGCINLADLNFPMMRPYTRVPFMLLCSVHIDRLLRHKCCPLCGVFCTRGTFVYCNQGHFYHNNCDPFYTDSSVCPHCGQSDTKEVTLTLAKQNNPFCLPSQRIFDKKLSARIFSQTFKGLDDLLKEKKQEDLPSVRLPSRHVITASNVPTIERELLKKCLSIFTSKNADAIPRSGNNKTLFQAVRSGDLEKVIRMLWSGMNINTCLKEGGPIHVAIRNGNLAMIHILVQGGASIELLDKEQYSPLMLACHEGHLNIVQYLIAAGADRTFKGVGGMTALHVAAKEGHTNCCQELLSNVGSPYSIVDAVDEGNWTPLVWAAENKKVDSVRLLLKKKANIQIRDTERNVALHWASLACSIEIIEDLLDAGSDINATNIYGDTPLHISAREGSADCVMLLLSRGAVPDLINKAGSTPRDCCRQPNPYIHDLITVSMKFTIVTQNIPTFPRIVSSDITRGKERYPIQCINEIDEDLAPSDFSYVNENCMTTNIQIDNKITSLIPCKCDEQPKADGIFQCTLDSCKCTLNSKGCWYDGSGRLIPNFNYEDPPLVFECNPACDCNELLCINRVVQKGMRQGLQVRKTEKKNWGVITLRDIPKGTYVCEYIGEIISDSEADTRHDDSYLFDLDNKEVESYCIDARRYGNITRFINHSCRPNLFPVRVFINHHDLRFPRIAFFAARDIPAHQELGYDYGEKFWMVKYKSFTCTCGEETCRYSEETIHETVFKYHQNLKLEEQAAL